MKQYGHERRNSSVVVLTAILLVALSLALAAMAAQAAPTAAAASQIEESGTVPAHEAEPAHSDEHHSNLGRELALGWAIPFAGILLSIALFPLFAPKFWHSHFPKVSAFWAIVFAVPFLIVYRGAASFNILEIYLLDYFPFIILLWGLFTVSGGILIRGTLRGTPQLNLLFLLIGTFLASWIGTTGASMVLIRPLLRANAQRKHKVHIIVFFIFLVSNIGGSLTPLGDPPLFLGFLHSVPFFWTFRLILEMGFLALILLALFFLFDRYHYRKETIEPFEPAPVSIGGLHNIVFLIGIIGAVLMSGLWKAGQVNVLGVPIKIESLLRDGLIILMGVLSLKTTKNQIHKDNEFSWFPIKEVAYLFAGIFMTIIPALAILKAGANGALGNLLSSLETPAHYFWVTGVLSSFLDNAPTYLTFFNSALGEFYAGIPEPAAVRLLIADHEIYLAAISCGAVFMGANTYIGNAPNFMVRSIAEEAGIRMPSFFGYMLRYSLPILIPIFLLVTLVFFS